MFRICSSYAGFLALLIMAAGCDSSPSEPSSSSAVPEESSGSHASSGTVSPLENRDGLRTFQVTGEVRKVEAASLTVKHEEVPDYMPAMTMPFDVKNTNELIGLQTGDEITFRLLVTEEEGWIENVRVLNKPNPDTPPPPPTFRVVRDVEPLEIGDPVPDYPLTNQLGQPIHLGQFKGKALAITFIFTRCPFPNFCPRLSKNFAEAYQELNARPDAPDNWHLLSVSFDPQFDTPHTLKAYAEAYHYDPDHWTFATGKMVEIDALTEQFGLMFSREVGSFNINHNGRTAVIDARGRVQRIFVGNEWRVADLVAELIKAARVED